MYLGGIKQVLGQSYRDVVRRRTLHVTAADPEGFADAEVSSVAVLSSDLTTFSILVKQTSDGVRILRLGADVPRLFCDFPLLGSETFPFPSIINNPTGQTSIGLSSATDPDQPTG